MEARVVGSGQQVSQAVVPAAVLFLQVRQERPTAESLLVLDPVEEQRERREPRGIVGHKAKLSVELLGNIAHLVVVIEP